MLFTKSSLCVRKEFEARSYIDPRKIASTHASVRFCMHFSNNITHTLTSTRLKKPSDEWEKESERVKVWQGRKISKWVQNMHFHMHKKGSPCVCVCWGNFSRRAYIDAGHKKAKFECVWKLHIWGWKKVPTRNFRVHFCAVWMQVDANIQHIRDAAALKKGTGKFLSANFEKRDTKTALEASESEWVRWRWHAAKK